MLLRAVLDVLAPPRCAACGRRVAVLWCRPCADDAAGLRRSGACQRCAGVGPAHACWPRPAPVASTRAAFRYTGPVAAAVVAGKARGAGSVWVPLGRHLLAAVAPAPPPVDAVTWVPTDPGRRRRRGLDQAQVLATAVAGGLGVPVVGVLRARSGRADQASRTVTQRRRVALAAFTPVAAAPPRILLVDDVLTTGGTVRAAAAALRRAGARVVHLAVVARAGDHPLAGR